MSTFWYKRDFSLRKNFLLKEMDLLILKGLLSNFKFSKNEKIYFGLVFLNFSKYSSIAYYRRSCIMTGNSRSVFRRFKMVRHWCKKYASDGILIGIRKSSF